MVLDESVGFREGSNPRRRAPVKAQCTLCANLHPTPKHVGNELMIRQPAVQALSALMGRDIFRLVARSLGGRHSTSTSGVAYGARHHNHRGLHG